MSVIRKVALLVALCAPLSVSAQVAGSSASASPGVGPEIADVIAQYSKRTGRKFIVDPRVRGLPVLAGIDADRMSYDQLLSMLSVNQFIAIPQGDVVVVTVDAIARQLPTPVHADTRFKAADDEWATVLWKVKNTCAAHLVPILRPLMPQAAHLAADPQSNMLVAADRAVNLRRIGQLVDRLDAGAPANRGCEDGKK